MIRTAVLLSLVACSSDPPVESSTTTQAPSVVPASSLPEPADVPFAVGGLANGAYAPQVVGTDIRTDSPFALSEYLGDSRVHPTKAAIVSFSASWCGPCRASLPQLAELKAQHGDELLVLIISIDEGEAGLAAEVRAVEQAGLDAPIVHADEALQRAWLGDTRNIPHMFIINQVGEVLVQDRGYGDNVKRVLPRQLGYALSHPEYVERD